MPEEWNYPESEEDSEKSRERETLSFACDLRSFFTVREDIKEILIGAFMLSNIPGVLIQCFYNE